MQVKTLEIKDIKTDLGTQIRVAIDEELVQNYHEKLEDGVEFPPVVVFFDGLRYILGGGFHRLFAHQRSNRLYIDADVRHGTLDDAIDFALQDNEDHGLRRSDADRRNAVIRALNDKRYADCSAREIARVCKVSHTTVNRIIKEREGLVKPKEKPAKLKNVVESPLEVRENPESEEPKVEQRSTHDDDMVQELVAENERLQDRLAVSAMDASEEEKALAQETIDDLRQQVKNLTIELEAVKKSRDQYQMECTQLKKQVAMYQRQLKKVS